MSERIKLFLLCEKMVLFALIGALFWFWYIIVSMIDGTSIYAVPFILLVVATPFAILLWYEKKHKDTIYPTANKEGE